MNPQKRKRTDQADGESNAQAPLQKKPFQPHQRFNKARPDQGHGESRTPSVGELRSRIRNLKRLLEHVESVAKHKMPATVRIERERELATCTHELAEKTAAAQAAERKRNLISKYHHVRFFDRQKATRTLKKLQRELAAQTAEGKSRDTELQRQIHDAEVAVNYAIYYPLMKPYSSLYPREKQDKATPAQRADGSAAADEDKAAKTQEAKGDRDMWAAVERAMAEGTLDQLRYSEDDANRRAKEHDLSKGKKKERKKDEATVKRQETNQERKKAAAAHLEGGDDSDGGFFE